MYTPKNLFICHNIESLNICPPIPPPPPLHSSTNMNRRRHQVTLTYQSLSVINLHYHYNYLYMLKALFNDSHRQHYLLSKIYSYLPYSLSLSITASEIHMKVFRFKQPRSYQPAPVLSGHSQCTSGKALP